MLAHLNPDINPQGRPSDYRPEYCDLVIEQMAKGISLTAFAGLIRVSREAVYNWMTVHSAFSDAVARANAARVLWWEQKLMRSRKGAETTAAIFALRNAAPFEWRDIKHVSTDINVRVETLSDAQLFAIASGKSMSDASVIDGQFERVSPQANER